MQNVDIGSFSALLTFALGLIGTELYGVFSHKQDATTITKEWRFADAWLEHHSPVADWIFRVATIGFLTWAVLHFAAGVR